LLEIGQHPKEAEASEHSAYRQILGLRAVHLMAFFILIYVGCVSYEEFSGLELTRAIQSGSYTRRLDRYIHHRSPRWWTILRLYFLRLLRRLDLWSYWAVVGEQQGSLIALFEPNHLLTGSKIGERRAIFLYSLLALG
jgi:hypothetical protein